MLYVPEDDDVVYTEDAVVDPTLALFIYNVDKSWFPIVDIP